MLKSCSCFCGVWNCVAAQLHHIKNNKIYRNSTGLIMAEEPRAHCPWENLSRRYEWWSNQDPHIFKRIRKPWTSEQHSVNEFQWFALFRHFWFSTCASFLLKQNSQLGHSVDSITSNRLDEGVTDVSAPSSGGLRLFRCHFCVCSQLLYLVGWFNVVKSLSLGSSSSSSL